MEIKCQLDATEVDAILDGGVAERKYLWTIEYDWGFSLPWLRFFSTLTEVFPCFFLSLRQMPLATQTHLPLQDTRILTWWWPPEAETYRLIIKIPYTSCNKLFSNSCLVFNLNYYKFVVLDVHTLLFIIRTDAITKEVLKPIAFVLAYPTLQTYVLHWLLLPLSNQSQSEFMQRCKRLCNCLIYCCNWLFFWGGGGWAEKGV